MTALRFLLPSAVVLLGVFLPQAAQADIERYAILIANNRGHADETELRYAERDAAKVEDVLRDLGGFPAENITTLKGSTPDAARRALIAVNDRIRVAGGDAMLFVYYSGHADASGLHLGRSTLRHDELQKLVRGSPATIRLLVTDSCRSGAVTRSKGARATASFALTLDDKLAGEGSIFLASSAANEDSQESDELQGSFFTHYLVSGLLGAADEDGDGSVGLDEAYRYAYENTLRASSKTAAGTQHPTFHYDVRGQGRIELTRPSAAAKTRARITVPTGRAFLLFRDNASGPVVAEVGESDVHRSVSLKPGTYFLRGRGAESLLEGSVTVSAGKDVVVADSGLARVEYARLVRKGGGEKIAHAFTVSGHLRQGLGGADPCLGGAVGYRADFAALSVTSGVGACVTQFANRTLEAHGSQLEVRLGAVHAWDTKYVSVELGVEIGASWLHQGFVTRGVAPSRNALSPHFGVVAGLSVDVSPRLFLYAELRGQTFLLRQTSGPESPDDAGLSAQVAAGTSLGVGLRY